MSATPARLAAVVLIWFLFGLAVAVAFLVFPVAWFLDEVEYAKNLFRALDKTTAALLGCSGRYSLSAECGAAAGGWKARLRPAIDWLLEPGHCDGAAKREGLT